MKTLQHRVMKRAAVENDLMRQLKEQEARSHGRTRKAPAAHAAPVPARKRERAPSPMQHTHASRVADEDGGDGAKHGRR